MKLKLWAAFGALLAAMPAAQAQQPSRTPDPADPSAPVPPTVYQSALTGYAPAAKDLPAPDKTWRAANATVAGQPDHGAHHAPEPKPEPEQRKDEAAPQEHQKHH